MLQIRKIARGSIVIWLFIHLIMNTTVGCAAPLQQDIRKSFLSPAIAISDILSVFLSPRQNQLKVEPDALAIVRNAFRDNAVYIAMELAMHKVIEHLDSEKIVAVNITAENGNSVRIKIPHPSAVSEAGDMQAVYKYYIAKRYALAVAMGNGPGANLYIKAEDSQGKRLPDVEAGIIAVAQNVFDAAGKAFTSKANAGNKVLVKNEPEHLEVSKAVTFAKRKILHISGAEYKQITGNDLITIGIDLGGKGMGPGIRVNGINVTDSLLPKAENEEELINNDQSLRYRYSFSKDEGGSGAELRDRLVKFVSQIVDVVSAKYGQVDAVFINSAGAPDFANDRFASIGALSRRFEAFGGMEKNMQAVNEFIPQLRKQLGVVVGFGNDMTGWAISIAEQAGFFIGQQNSRAGAILTGGGIGAKEMNDGVAVAGMNEGGHFVWNSGDMVESFSRDSPLGSFEDWAGSVRGIVNESKRVFGVDGKSLFQKLQAMGIKDVDPKHIGLAASGLNPLISQSAASETAYQRSVDPELQRLAYQVWDNIEQREAQYIVFIYKLRGLTRFAFGGGTTAGDTGKIRLDLLKKYISEYTAQLGIKDEITVELVRDADPTDGAAVAAEHWFQDYIANQLAALGGNYETGASFAAMLKEWDRLNQISEFSVGSEISALNHSI
ncbi:MAG: hypothetical protein V1747_00245 [Candidatus Omnitrophota bacterium]